MQKSEKVNQCGETCERAKLCAVCAKELSAPAAPVAPDGWALVPVEPTPEMLFALQGGVPRLIPAYVGAQEKADAMRLQRYRAMLDAAPAALVAQPSDADIDAVVAKATGFDGDGTQEMNAEDLRHIARAVLALRPKVQPLTPRGFLLHWPKPGGGRELIWSEKDGAGVMIGCPVEPVYSYGVRKEGGAA